MQRNYFANREWSFTLASDAYIRFQSFRGAEDLKAEILRLCPVKIDIGAVYNLQVGDYVVSLFCFKFPMPRIASSAEGQENRRARRLPASGEGIGI